MSFLPNGYEPQQSGGRFFKLKIGKNQFRPIGTAIIGLEGWASHGDKRSPVRRRIDAEGHASPPFAPGEVDANEKIKEFMAFPVIDRADGAIKIAQFTQSSIKGSIASMAGSEDWGDPSDANTGYDIIIERKGSGMETEYSVMPAKARGLTPAERKLIAETPLNLPALYDNGDPFDGADGPVNNGELQATAFIADIKQAKLAGGRVKYGIVTTTGETFGTFDAEIADFASARKVDKVPVVISYVHEGDKMTAIDIAADANAEAETTGASGGMSADDIPFSHGFHAAYI